MSEEIVIMVICGGILMGLMMSWPWAKAYAARCDLAKLGERYDQTCDRLRAVEGYKYELADKLEASQAEVKHLTQQIESMQLAYRAGKESQP